jgi:hypothetical protein
LDHSARQEVQRWEVASTFAGNFHQAAIEHLLPGSFEYFAVLKSIGDGVALACELDDAIVVAGPCHYQAVEPAKRGVRERADLG